MAATLTSTFGGYLNTVTKNVKSDINPRNFMFNIGYSCLGNTFNFTELGYKKHLCSHGQAWGELLLGPRVQHGHERGRTVSV